MYSYYGELCTKMYEVTKSAADGKELEFYLAYAADKETRVLEPMCGNGRMLIPFQQHGVNIEGFDLSEEMLTVCRKKAERVGLTANVWADRIEAFTADKPYDLIFIPVGSFSLLPEELIKPSLMNLKRALKPDGRLLLTIVTDDIEIEEHDQWVETNRKKFGDEEIVEFRKVENDSTTKTLTTQLKYHLIKGKDVVQEERMNFPVLLYSENIFKHILIQNGFQHVTIHYVKDGSDSFRVFECSI
ncbi:class I SAM-dependent methyltransferase [Jeotgalibacillus malaysiensis]|uniref:class I SAM-dependent methyltransferase n=1 Tax=Jeotgalibacillus malaysiensis TaxID=1508404 RepID=UPI00384A4DD8